VKFVEEYRDGAACRALAAAIRRKVTRPWSLMEVCGGQTHAIVRFGLDELLPREVGLIHGPGCPVCVTPVALIDQALAIAARPGVVFCSFGDMLRVPGSTEDLLSVKSRGADVRAVYSPLDALALARELPGREVVFFAVGFETTAPANALAVAQARREGLRNFSVLVSQVRVPPALEAILASPRRRVDALLAAGHVCSVMGTAEYLPLAARHRIPIVVTAFEPVDLLQGILLAVSQLEEGRAEVENQYARLVKAEGNRPAQRLMAEVFEVVDRTWRGIGSIPASGFGLREAYADFDAGRRFGVAALGGAESPDCQSGLVLQGLLKPMQCPAFGGACTPDHPLGATMVSGEGACAAYYRYRRFEPAETP
jgi:hydrogenase expression/formation protein HypD